MTKTPFPTKEELLAVIARQKELFDQPALRYDPPWLQDSEDPHRKEFRENQRLKSRLTVRLDKATKGFEQDFDLNS